MLSKDGAFVNPIQSLGQVLQDFKIKIESVKHDLN